MAEKSGRTPLEALDDVAAALEENTEAMERLRNRYRVVVGVVIALALTFVVVLKFNYDGAVKRCESGNELRVDIDTKWQAITDFIAPTTANQPTGPEFLALISEDLEKRDCGDINWLGQ